MSDRAPRERNDTYADAGDHYVVTSVGAHAQCGLPAQADLVPIRYIMLSND